LVTFSGVSYHALSCLIKSGAINISNAIRALAPYCWGAEDSVVHGHPPMTVVQLMQNIIYGYLAQSQALNASVSNFAQTFVAANTNTN
jgi:hypothetical protein